MDTGGGGDAADSADAKVAMFSDAVGDSSSEMEVMDRKVGDCALLAIVDVRVVVNGGVDTNAETGSTMVVVVRAMKLSAKWNFILKFDKKRYCLHCTVS